MLFLFVLCCDLWRKYLLMLRTCADSCLSQRVFCMMFCFDGNSFTPLMIKKKMHLHLNLGWATLWYVTSPCAIWYKSCLALQGLLESHCGLCRIVLDSLCTVKLTPSNICNGWELIRIDGNWSDLINIDAILDPVYQSNSLSILLSLLSSAKGSLHRFLVSTHVCDRCTVAFLTMAYLKEVNRVELCCLFQFCFQKDQLPIISKTFLSLFCDKRNWFGQSRTVQYNSSRLEHQSPGSTWWWVLNSHASRAHIHEIFKHLVLPPCYPPLFATHTDGGIPLVAFPLRTS